MKYMKRAQIYKGNNVTFNPATKDAYSYGWWRFVAVVEGVLLFNNFRYSVTTAKHQRKVAGVMHELGIRENVTLALPRGIRHDQTLAELYLEAEEHECDAFLEAEAKRDERNARATLKRRTQKLEEYLENQCAFRDYEVRSQSEFGKVNTVAVHQCVDFKSLEYDVRSALDSFGRDGFGSVVFYV